jgi:hypothetical protein
MRALFVSLILPLVAMSAVADETVKLEAILRVPSKTGGERLTTIGALASDKMKTGVTTAFVAVIAQHWPTGVVPLFAVATDDTFELRRLPARGSEAHSEPLFFALPPDDETNAAKISGKWNAVAANIQRSNHSPDWELAVNGERVAGRFDPHGEYRVAFITGGTFRSNRLELNVEYINDHYVLTGDWRDGKLSGVWKHLEESEAGTWEATRPQRAPKLPSDADAVPLYEWRHGNQRHYSVATNINEAGWQRAERPLCRVWRKHE